MRRDLPSLYSLAPWPKWTAAASAAPLNKSSEATPGQGPPATPSSSFGAPQQLRQTGAHGFGHVRVSCEAVRGCGVSRAERRRESCNPRALL